MVAFLRGFVAIMTLMVTKPQSCKRAFTVRQWFGKDDAKEMAALLKKQSNAITAASLF